MVRIRGLLRGRGKLLVVLQLPDSIEEALAVDGDHSTMVKFENSNHRSYTSVVRHLKTVALDAGTTRMHIPPLHSSHLLR